MKQINEDMKRQQRKKKIHRLPVSNYYTFYRLHLAQISAQITI